MVRAKRVFCVVAYDVSDDKRRSKVVKILEKHGVRVNFSVFECILTECKYEKMQQALEKQINMREDRIVYYPVCVNCFTRIVYQPERFRKIKTVEIY
jgi:CRISPR-associated protein Cas2